MSQVPERFANLSPLKRAVLALQEVQAKLEATEHARTEPIAVIGMGCRIPGGAADPESLWRLLRDGVSVVKEVPKARFDIDALYDPSPDAPGKICTKWGGYLDDVDTFDASFFGIAAREAVTMDPQQRLFLEVSWEALEHAGIAADRLKGSRTGVFVGIAASDYAELLREVDADRIDAYHTSGIAHSIASGRLSYILGLQGPSISIDTACSSSLVAVHLACQSLRTGECRMALAGGVNLILTPHNSIVFSKSHMLAADGRCKTFDAAADGFARAEGCGVIVLKRLSDALADGDRIAAVIRGTAANQDGPSSGLTAPNGPAQEAVIREALANGGVKPAQVSYVEAHGTGTSLGDPIELQALGAALADDRPSDRNVIVGSLKTNVGHLEAAAGVAGLIKVVLSLQHEEIPAHLHFKEPNPHVAWEDLPLTIPVARTPWPRTDVPRIGGVSSFGFSGTNVHIVLEEAPVQTAPAASVDRPAHVLTLSARTPLALTLRARALKDRLLSMEDPVSVADVAHTANAGRAHFPHRVALQGSIRTDLIASLDAFVEGKDDARVRAGEAAGTGTPKIAFLFTGQGAQYAGMGRALYQTEPIFRQTLDRCDEILKPLLEHSVLSVLYGDQTDLLDRTEYTQPALFSIEYALAALWRSWGIEPSVLIGHSIGEYVAATISGVFALEEALKLVAARGRLMQALPQNGAMVAVMADEARVVPLLAERGDRISIAAINGPASVVVSGEASAVAALVSDLTVRGIRSKPLTVSHAFHSPLMNPMLDEFEAIASSVRFGTPRIRVISNVTGRVASSAELTSPAYWRRHVREAVRFADGIGTVNDLGIHVFLEAGPHPTLVGMGMGCVGGDARVWLPSLRRGQDDWRQMLDSVAALYVAGSNIDWAAFDRHTPRRRVDLPTYPFQRERFWVEPGTTKRVTGSRSPDARENPLLGRRFESPLLLTDIVFESELGPDTHAYLYDHRVHDTPILPATGFVEMALAAGAATFAGRGRPIISNFVIHEALVLPESRTVRTQVVVGTDAVDRRPFRIFSRVHDHAVDNGTASWKLHAEGTLSAESDDQTPQTSTLDELMASCGAVPVDRFYRSLEQRGLAFGPAFHPLSDLRAGVNEALGLVQLPAPLARDVARHYVHPVLLDGALQVVGAALIAMTPDADGETYLPLAFDRCELPPDLGPQIWSHVRLAEVGKDGMVRADIQILDATGRRVGAIVGLRMKRADRSALLRLRKRDVSEWLYEVEWEPAARQRAAGSADWVPSLSEAVAFSRQDIERVTVASELPAYDEVQPRLEDLSLGYVVAALNDLGWQPRVGDRIHAEALAGTLNVAPKHLRLFTRLLQILEEDGALQRSSADPSTWQVVRVPAPQDVETALEALQPRSSICEAELILLGRCGPFLAAVLRGEADPLALLFPNGSVETAEKLYQESATARAFNGLIGEAIEDIFARVPAGTRVRILEIGGGTGSTSSFVLPRVANANVEYVFSDISPMFTARAAKKFDRYPFFRSQRLDIEQDPATQGLAGERFDIIVAANVLHATTDLRTTFKHVRQLLAPNGLLVMLEVTRPQRWIDLTFGMTDGWWKFTDHDLRPDYPLISESEWVRFLESASFAEARAIPASRDVSPAFGLQSVMLARNSAHQSSDTERARWVIFGDRTGVGEQLARQLEAQGRDVALVSDADALGHEAEELLRAAASQGAIDGIVHLWALDAQARGTDSTHALNRAIERTCGSALDLVKALASGRYSSPELWLVTRGAQGGGRLAAPDAPAQATLWGLGKAIALEHPELRCVRVDLDPTQDPQQAAATLAGEIAAPDAEDQIALRGGIRHVARLVRRSNPASPEAGAASYRLDSRARGTLDNLVFYPAARRRPGAGEVEIEVQISALNFKDVMNALGMYPGDPGPLGSECGGRIVAVGPGVHHLDVGDDVIAVASGSHARFVTTPAGLVARRPAHLTREAAVTVPIAFLTAHFALSHLATLRAGERVLIHAAAGGVGMAAVQLALRAGAEVFATAGSDEKRAVVSAMGVRHVMSSRTSDFANEILELTSGRGVDVVLNSLAGDLRERSFDVLAAGGRFLEIGKNGIWTGEQVEALGKRIGYFVIDWGVDAKTNPPLIEGLLRDLMQMFEARELAPLPYRLFPIAQTEPAFRYMAQGRHIGKILIAHDSTPMVEAEGPVPIRADATYLVTGGLSGLGLLTAEWLVSQGARNLVLVGRRGVSDESRTTLAALEGVGATIRAVRGDVSNEDDVHRIVRDIEQTMPPLRGIVHSAGVLDDGALVQQDWSRFARVLGPKVGGAWSLHRATAAARLDFFVIYSSVASVLGSPGQGNHSAANAFLDAFAQARRADGLPALSINWGAWSEIGAAARLGVVERASLRGIGTIAPAEGLGALARLTHERRVQTAVLPIDWPVFTRQFGTETPPFFSQLSIATAPARAAKASEGPGLVQQLEDTPAGGRLKVLHGHVRERAARVLGAAAPEAVDPRRPLNEQGLDSLMAVELRNVLGASVGQTLPATLLFDYPTVDAVAERLASVLGLTAAPVAAQPDEMSVLSQISDLSDDEVDRLFAERLAGRH